ncbi:hypothetical protein HOY82DRAFT_644898 [Tuber indicum]|nr:hypothetical protein HOY82DRAFT_644898 [Tuber indicum]
MVHFIHYDTRNFNGDRKTQFVIGNVFSLGHTHLQLVQILAVRSPHIDPSAYVHRFAKHLDSGNERTMVTKGALHIIQPAELAIQKQLDEFGDAECGDLTVEEFRIFVIEDPQNITVVIAPVG